MSLKDRKIRERCSFNLTNFFDKNFKILISRRIKIFTKTSHLKLVGTPCKIPNKHRETFSTTLSLKSYLLQEWKYLFLSKCHQRIQTQSCDPGDICFQPAVPWWSWTNVKKAALDQSTKVLRLMFNTNAMKRRWCDYGKSKLGLLLEISP